MSRKQRYFVYGIVTLSMMIWGMTFIWYKQVFIQIRPVSLVFLRLLIASPVLLLVTALGKRLQYIRRRDLPSLYWPFLNPFYILSARVSGCKGFRLPLVR
jgi:drug/metabolite transporter (DMT)-like permease